MFILRHKTIFFIISGLLVVVALTGIISRGFNWGIDFKGGSVIEIAYTDAVPTVNQVQNTARIVHPDTSVQQIGTNGFLIRTKELSQADKDGFIKNLSSTGKFEEKRFNTIGPSVGKELRTKSILSMILVSIGIILFVAFAFRSISQPISSWKYGLIVIAVLFHDILIPAGFFAWTGMQVDTLFVVGLLTILGVSVNDTIVVFDRIRDNLNQHYHGKDSLPFDQIVGKSISETFTRSLMTSVTVLLALAALVVFGPASTHTLSLTMLLGMFFGTYSSIFVAAPLLVVWNNRQQKNQLETETKKK